MRSTEQRTPQRAGATNRRLPPNNMIELQVKLTSIPNLISNIPLEVNSSVSGSSPIKILRSGMGYKLSLSSISIFVSFPKRDPQGFSITLSMKTTDVKS